MKMFMHPARMRLYLIRIIYPGKVQWGLVLFNEISNQHPSSASTILR